jgi:flagellar hook-basal body complex protein FliE
MEDKVGDESSGGEENEKLLFSKERESNEHIKNEFEEKMKVEKKRFQETLNSLRQEIERLQKERSKAMNEISTKQEDRVKQVIVYTQGRTSRYNSISFSF